MDVLVLNYNDAPTTTQFVKSIRKYSCIGTILVVDNCSTDSSFGDLLELSDEKTVVVKTERNGGYGYGNNYGIRYLYDNYKSKFILLSNPDVVVDEDTLRELEKFLQNNREYAVAAPFMLDSNGNRCLNAAFKIPSKKDFILSTNWLYEHICKPLFYKDVKMWNQSKNDVDAVAGSLFLMNADYIVKSGMFDEKIFLYWEEIVLGMRIKAINKKVALLTNISYVHNHSVSISKTYKSAISKKRLFIKSKLYVLRHYYLTNYFERLWALCIAKISLIDIIVVPKMVKIWKIIRCLCFRKNNEIIECQNKSKD
jgi:GT2 family glycosyltransferase